MARPITERPGDRREPGPDGRSVLVEWFRKGRGPFGLDRRLGQARATHARVSEVTRDGRPVRQWIVPVAEVDGVVDEVRAGWSAPAPAPASSASADSGGADPEDPPNLRGVGAPTDPAPTPVRPTCRYCDVERAPLGRHRFVERVGLGFDLGFRQEGTDFDVHACPRCGSVELFVPGAPGGPQPGPRGDGGADGRRAQG